MSPTPNTLSPSRKWKPVLITIILGIITWGFIANQVARTVTLVGVPIHLHYNAKEMIQYPSQELKTNLTVKPRLLQNVSADDFSIEAYIPLSAIPNSKGPFTYKLQLKNHMVKRPSIFCTIIEIATTELKIPMDCIITKEDVTVRPIREGLPEQGYTVELTAKPETVSLTGPSSVVQNIGFINTEVVKITTNINTEFIKNCSLVPPKIPGYPIQLGQNEVQVTVSPKRSWDSRDEVTPIRDSPLLILNSAKPNVVLAEPLTTTVEITLRGSTTKQQRDKIAACVNLSKVRQPGSQILPIELLNVPEYVEASYMPKDVTLVLKDPSDKTDPATKAVSTTPALEKAATPPPQKAP